MNSNLKLEYLFEDAPDLDPTALPDYTTLDFVSNGSHIYGEIMWPSETIKGPPSMCNNATWISRNCTQ